ncbi:uncharacterized protein CIMG_03764 [Coccidioides immitis RS]|uniref:Uncharacterized protein n=3 Tax=Coccidioides immitis TaxID=5501 RepID=A0A0J8R4N8_COCIT|nr:uncharacterized protein CIMG_03764 [Coccidioides immitis RS]EAS32740.3 hypothetical protein CIMG_03764 [Coccidioides immitis RS]KMP08003.1 hypothetical protein CIRG_07684 [Coccidioides immitis RMSCC 2394]KMU79711.1 hypothetical protein CISG_02129 [Coccidioides immitis RMSCC 3703]KMU85197.1 hypothetical protein CIHG_02980 [Coccidioides immitis H538.4]
MAKSAASALLHASRDCPPEGKTWEPSVSPSCFGMIGAIVPLHNLNSEMRFLAARRGHLPVDFERDPLRVCADLSQSKLFDQSDHPVSISDKTDRQTISCMYDPLYRGGLPSWRPGVCSGTRGSS